MVSVAIRLQPAPNSLDYLPLFAGTVQFDSFLTRGHRVAGPLGGCIPG
jgi:hypothetical protein